MDEFTIYLCKYCSSRAKWLAVDPAGRQGYACGKHINRLLDYISRTISDQHIKISGLDWLDLEEVPDE